jgi:ribosomal protein S18 acetylase RimI-like enzyme
MAEAGYVLMRLALEPRTIPAAPPQPPQFDLVWSHGDSAEELRRSRAKFVALHRDIGDEVGADPEVFDSTFGGDPAALAGRMLFLRHRASGAGRAVGTCTAWGVGGTGWVHSLAVGTEFQGRGLSKLLLAAVLIRLHELGHRTVMLAVRPSSLRAITLYQEYGFAPVLEDEDDCRQWHAASAQAAAARLHTGPLRALPDGYRARAVALLAEPAQLGAGTLTEFALCGMSAVVYSLLRRRPAAFVRLVQLLFCSDDCTPEGSGGAQLRARLAEMGNKPSAAEGRRESRSPAAARSPAAEFDFVICRGLAEVLRQHQVRERFPLG